MIGYSNNPMRVAHCDFSSHWRGGQQQLMLLARVLRSQGIEQTIVAPMGPVAERFRAEGFEVMRPGWSAMQRARRADAVHAHDGRAQGWMIAAGFLGGSRQPQRILTRRVAFPIQRWDARWKYRRMDRILAVSAYVRNCVLDTGVPPDRVLVVPDGIDIDRLPDPVVARRRVRETCGLDSATRCVACVGALSPEKGVGDIIAAFARLPRDWRLLLTGTGREQNHLKRQAQDLGIADRIVWAAKVGVVSTAEWVAASDLLVMPSHLEGFGSALLLGMALRCPIVATRTGGIPEVARDEENALLVRVGDTTAMAAACERILSDSGLGARLTAAGHEMVLRQYTVAQLARSTVAAYRIS